MIFRNIRFLFNEVTIKEIQKRKHHKKTFANERKKREVLMELTVFRPTAIYISFFKDGIIRDFKETKNNVKSQAHMTMMNTREMYIIWKISPSNIPRAYFIVLSLYYSRGFIFTFLRRTKEKNSKTSWFFSEIKKKKI